MFEEEKILIITKFGIEGYSLLAKIASRHDKIVWVSSNPYIPDKILKAYSCDAELFGFYPRIGKVINPLNLNEVSLAVSHAGGGENSCVIISCISELIMYHGVGKVYHFLLNVMRNTRKVIGMMVDGAQDKRDELLISTLFDAVFRIEKNENDVLLVPELHVQNRAYRIKCSDCWKMTRSSASCARLPTTFWRKLFAGCSPVKKSGSTSARF